MGSKVEAIDDLKWGKQWVLEEIRRQTTDLGICIKDEQTTEPFIVWKIIITPDNGEQFTLAFYYESITRLRESALRREDHIRVRFKQFIELSLRHWLLFKTVPEQQFYLYKDHQFRVVRDMKHFL